jgi:hypothetical protein
VCQSKQTTCSNVSEGSKDNSLQDALHWRIILGADAIEMQRVFARALSRAKAIFSDA